MVPFIAPLLIFLPGYLITLFLPFASGFFKRLAFSIVLSLSAEIALSYLLAVFNPLFLKYFLPFIAIGALILGLIGRKRLLILVEEWRALRSRERLFSGALLALAVAAGIFIFYPHFGYTWPIHADEWWDVSAVQSVLHGRPLNTNPYLFTSYPDYKPGFTSLMAGMLGGLGLNPVAAWPYLPAVNIFLISFISSTLLFDRTKNYWIAGLAPVFLSALRSNVYILGWWFFVPSSFALLFLLFLLINAADWFESRSAVAVAALVAVALGLIYLPLLGFSALALAPFAPRLYRKFRPVFWGVMLAALAILAAVLALSPYQSYWPAAVSVVLKSFFVPVSATVAPFGFFGVLGVVPIFVLIFGLLGAWWLRRMSWALSIVAAGIFTSIAVALVYATQTSFLLFYQRLYCLFGAIFAILAAVGLGTLIVKVSWKMPLKWGLVVLALATSFCGYTELPPGMQLYYLVAPADLTALRWLKTQHGLDGQLVISPPSVGTIITPLSGLPSKVNWLTAQAQEGSISALDASFFSTADCVAKQNLLVVLNADLVYSHAPQNCPFLREVYGRNNIFIYEKAR